MPDIPKFMNEGLFSRGLENPVFTMTNDLGGARGLLGEVLGLKFGFSGLDFALNAGGLNGPGNNPIGITPMMPSGPSNN